MAAAVMDALAVIPSLRETARRPSRMAADRRDQTRSWRSAGARSSWPKPRPWRQKGAGVSHFSQLRVPLTDRLPE